MRAVKNNNIQQVRQKCFGQECTVPPEFFLFIWKTKDFHGKYMKIP